MFHINSGTNGGQLTRMFAWVLRRNRCSQLTIEERAKRLGVEIDGDPRTITYILSIEESYFCDSRP
jgi:hypothetical protein